jgi:hypothetical protein
MQKQIDELEEKLEQYQIDLTKSNEKQIVSLTCINELITRVPGFLEQWPNSLCNEEEDKDTLTNLRELEDILINLKNENSNIERPLTSLEKELSDNYKKSVQDLDQLRIQNEKLVAENTKLKNELKNSEILVKTSTADTDFLMKKLLKKNDELSQLKEKIVELERRDNYWNKSIVNSSETSIIKDQNSDTSTELGLVSNINQDQDHEMLKLNEIIQAKELEITKYQQNEEAMKIENESLKKALDATSKTVQTSKECQTEIILNDQVQHNEQKSWSNEISHQQNDSISKFSTLIQEPDNNIEYYQRSTEQMKKKIEELQQCLDTNKIERISQECQTEYFLYCDNQENLLVEENKDIKISKLLKIIEQNKFEIEKYKEILEETKKVELSEVNMSIINEKRLFKESLNNNYEENKSNNNLIKDNEVSRLENIIEKSNKEVESLQFSLSNKLSEQDAFINGYSQNKKSYEKLEESKQLQEGLKNNEVDEKVVECEMEHSVRKCENNSVCEEQITECIFDNNKQSEIDFNNSKLNKEIISIEESEFAHKICEEEKIKSIIYEEDYIDAVKDISKKFKDCPTEYISNSSEHINVDINEVKNNEIYRLSKIIDEQSLQITMYKQLEENLRKEIECSKQSTDHLITIKHLSQEIQTEVFDYDNEKIEYYQEQIATLVTKNEEFETKLVSLNNELIIKIEDIEKLGSLINELKNEIIKKTHEMSNLKENVELKVQNLEQKINIIELERNELKTKINYISSKDLIQDFKKEDNDSKTNLDLSKLENKKSNEHVEILKTLSNDEFNLSITNHENLVMRSPLKPSTIALKDNTNSFITTPTKLSEILSMSSISDSVKSPDLKSVANHQPVSMDKLDVNLTALMDSDNFLKPANVSIMEQKDSSMKLNLSPTVSNDKKLIKSLNKNFELESSSIFANNTYFDEMEFSQTFIQNSTTLFTANEESKNISNISTNINIQLVRF